MRKIKKMHIVATPLLLLTSCFNGEFNLEKKKHKIFRDEQYRPSVLSNFGNYEKLIRFLESHKNELINYRIQLDKENSENTNSSGTGCFGFGKESKVPKNLENEYYRLINQMDDKDFQFAELCKDGESVSILLNDYGNDIIDGRILIHHYLYKNIAINPVDTCIEKGCDLVKDTSLQNGIHYEIWISLESAFPG